jgi:hypothetical protein
VHRGQRRQAGKLADDPERILAFRIAESLGVNPDVLPDLLTARQKSEYMQYFEWLDTRRDKFDYYLAQIAGFTSGKARFKISEFLAPGRNEKRATVSAEDAAKILRAQYGKT